MYFCSFCFLLLQKKYRAAQGERYFQGEAIVNFIFAPLFMVINMDIFWVYWYTTIFQRQTTFILLLCLPKRSILKEFASREEQTINMEIVGLLPWKYPFTFSCFVLEAVMTKLVMWHRVVTTYILQLFHRFQMKNFIFYISTANIMKYNYW